MTISLIEGRRSRARERRTMEIKKGVKRTGFLPIRESRSEITGLNDRADGLPGFAPDATVHTVSIDHWSRAKSCAYVFAPREREELLETRTLFSEREREEFTWMAFHALGGVAVRKRVRLVGHSDEAALNIYVRDSIYNDAPSLSSGRTAAYISRKKETCEIFPGNT